MPSVSVRQFNSKLSTKTDMYKHTGNGKLSEELLQHFGPRSGSQTTYIARQSIIIDFCHYKLEEKKKNKINLIQFQLRFLKHHSCISDVICVLESIKASLLSSNDCFNHFRNLFDCLGIERYSWGHGCLHRN